MRTRTEPSGPPTRPFTLSRFDRKRRTDLARFIHRYNGFREIGFGVFFASLAMVFIHLGFSYVNFFLSSMLTV
jgi:hypothetical protein